MASTSSPGEAAPSSAMLRMAWLRPTVHEHDRAPCARHTVELGVTRRRGHSCLVRGRVVCLKCHGIVNTRGNGRVMRNRERTAKVERVNDSDRRIDDFTAVFVRHAALPRYERTRDARGAICGTVALPGRGSDPLWAGRSLPGTAAVRCRYALAGSGSIYPRSAPPGRASNDHTRIDCRS